MEELISRYILAFDEINAMTTFSYLLADKNDRTRTAKQVADDLLSYLIKAYTEGIQAASIMLDYDLDVDTDSMYDVIYTVIDGMTFEDRVLDHVMKSDLAGLQVLAESEYHRVYNNAIEDGGKEYLSYGNCGISKTWITVKDNRVRKTHAYLEGEAVPFDEEFFTFDGDHASFPGGFTRAENNVNCRCTYQLKIDEE